MSNKKAPSINKLDRRQYQSTNSPKDIAIIGMSGVFAVSQDINEYWQNILNKVSGISEAPDSWSEPYFDPESTENDRIGTRMGGFMGDNARFNSMEFGIMPNAVGGGEPDHFIALKLARDALKDAGYWDKEFDRHKTGVIFGHGTYLNRSFGTLFQHGMVIDQTLEMLKQFNPELDDIDLDKIRTKLKSGLPSFNPDVVPSLVPNVLTGRIANRLDLMGPNYLVEAACSSSLIALELGVKELLNGRCDMVLVGGANSASSPQLYMMFHQIGALTPTIIKPFDKNANGTLPGEGLGIVVLKRLEDAERDNDRIYAVIKGVSSSSDGKAKGLLAPRFDGQVLALERTYGESGIDPDTVELIEAHGTGMPLGDQTEVETLTHIYGGRDDHIPYRALGSVKSMIGHLFTAAGIAGLIKTTLALYHKVLPPTLCDEVDPELGFENTAFYINTETRPWIHGTDLHPRRAGVNAFGFGGTNAHTILEEYTGTNSDEIQFFNNDWPSEIFLFTGNDSKELLDKVSKVRELLKAEPEIRISNLSFTLAEDTKDPGDFRLAIVAKSASDLAEKIDSITDRFDDKKFLGLQGLRGIFYGEKPKEGKTSFIFAGQGSQYTNMFAQLCLYFPKVRAWFDLLDELYTDRKNRPCSLLYPPPTCVTKEEKSLIAEELFSMEFTNDVAFCAELAVNELLDDFGINSDAMVGHSTGENSALIASGIGAISERERFMDSIRAFNRSYKQIQGSDVIQDGILLTVASVKLELLEKLVQDSKGKLHIALDNCPNQIVLYGKSADIEAIIPALEKEGGFTDKMPFDKAYHTSVFKDAANHFRSCYENMQIEEAVTPLYSCATADVFPSDKKKIVNLAIEMWHTRVRFRETIEKMYEDGIRTFIEVGPSGNLTAFVDDILHGSEYRAMASNNRRRSDLEQIQCLLGQLFTDGHSLEFSPLFAQRSLENISIVPGESDDNGKKNLGSILDLTIPKLELENSFVDTFADKRIKPVEPAKEKTAPVKPHEPVQHQQPVTTPAAPIPTPPVQPAVQETPQPVTASAYASADDPKSQAIATHFQLMNEFLASQNRVMTKFTGEESPGIPAVQQHFTSPQPAAVAATTVQAQTAPPIEEQLSFEEAWPMLGRIVEQTADKLYCINIFDVEKDLFLKDHTLAGIISERHPETHALAVMPFVGSAEVLAEAAACIFNGTKKVVSVYDLRGYRWLSFDHGKLEIGILANRLPDQDDRSINVQVELYIIDRNNGDEKQVKAYEGKVKLADAYPAPPPMLDIDEEKMLPSNVRDDQLYNNGVPDNPRFSGSTHGPSFQGLKHLESFSDDGIIGELEVVSLKNFFKNAPNARFQTDPTSIDSAGQMASHWLAELYGVDWNLLPYLIGGIHMYGELPPPGTKLIAKSELFFGSAIPGMELKDARFEFLDYEGNIISSSKVNDYKNFQLPDDYYVCRLQPEMAVLEGSVDFIEAATGRLVARMDGWQERFFPGVPHNVYQWSIYPLHWSLSSKWMQKETGLVCRRIKPIMKTFWTDSWGIWARKFAHTILNENERKEYYSFKADYIKNENFLLGRLAAKDAIRQWLNDEHNETLAPLDIEIKHNGDGKPFASCPSLSHIQLPEISISHSNEYSIAAAAPIGKKIGIDFERIRDDLSVDDLLTAGFTQDEKDIIEAVDADKRERTIIGIWCAKEAAAKALGTGLKYDPTKWTVTSLPSEDGNLVIVHEGEEYHCTTWNAKNAVLAVCLIDLQNTGEKELIAVEEKDVSTPSESVSHGTEESTNSVQEQTTEDITGADPEPVETAEEIKTEVHEGIQPEEEQSEEDLEKRRELEEKLKTMWQEVLKVETVGLDDDFFDLGGQSMLAVRLMGKVRELTQENIPIAQLIKVRTIREMVDLLTQEGGIKQESMLSSLVPFQEKGSKRPLFFAHSLGGNVLNYRLLSEYLGEEQPFYGLQAKGVYGDEEPLTTVSDMAAHYIKEIRTIQEKGPYFIGGFSGGGITAFEMANQLIAAGEEVPLVVMFDSYEPSYMRYLKTRWILPPQVISMLWVLSLHWYNMRSKSFREMIDYIAYRLKNGDWRSRNELPPQLKHVQRITRDAVMAYEPEPVDVRVTLFRAIEQQKSIRRDLGWEKVAKEGVEVVDIPGAHGHMVEEPHVKVSQARLIEIVENAEKHIRDL